MPEVDWVNQGEFIVNLCSVLEEPCIGSITTANRFHYAYVCPRLFEGSSETTSRMVNNTTVCAAA